MKIKDRLLILRRALLIAFNPDVDVVIVTRVDKKGEHHKSCIFTDRDIATGTYLEHLCDMFLSHAKDGSFLNNTSLVFMREIQNRWNALHPEDKVAFIVEGEITDDSRTT